MTTLEKHLNKIFFNPKSPAFFAAPHKLKQILERKGFKPTLKYLKYWTEAQETYSLNKPARKKFQKSHVIVKGVGSMYDADLADMVDLADDNDGVKFLLVIVDVFSKKLAVRPLKTKTALEVKQGIQSIFEKDLEPPELLRSDAGREFVNNTLRDFLEEKRVRFQVARNEGHANFAERVIKTIKGKIFRLLTHKNTRHYINKLQDIVKGYNASIHNTTGMKPKDVTPEIGKKIWWKIYKPVDKPKLSKPFKFKIGDNVRITYLKNKFTREYDQRWTGEIFTVYLRYRQGGVPLYKLKDYNLDPIEGSFYTEELQKVHIDENKLWKIEEVLKRRTRKGQKEYLVKWLHWPEKFNSWVTDLENV